MSTSDTWTGQGRNTSWFDRGNWSGHVPQASDTVLFTDGGSWSVRLASQRGRIAQANSLTIAMDTLTLHGGSLALGAFATSPDLTVDQAGALAVAAGASVTTRVGLVIGSLDEANGTTTTGAVTVGGTLVTASVNDVGGTLSVLAEGALDVSGTMVLTPLMRGFPLPSTMLTVGGTVTAGTIVAAGTIALSGSGASLDAGTFQSDGTLTIADGAQAGITTVELGSVYSSNFGVVAVEGAGSILTAGVIADDGNESNTSLTVEGGGTITAGAIDFNTFNTFNEVTVTGTGSSIDAGTLAIEGLADPFTFLSITDGGAVSAGGLSIELCPLKLDASALLNTPAIDSIAGTIDAVSGGGKMVTVDAAVMLNLPTFTGNGQTVFMSADGVTLDVTGAITAAAGTVLDTVGSVLLTNSGNLLQSVVIESGTLTLGAPGAVGTGGIDFANATGGDSALQIDTGTSLANVLSGFTTGDTIDLRGFGFQADIMDSFKGGTLTLTSATGTARLDFSGSYNVKDFLIKSDGHGGTLIRLHK